MTAYQTSTIPQAIDALLALFRGLPACQPPVAVYDGLPTDLADTFVVVGGRTEPVGHGMESIISFPATHGDRLESYDVDVTVSAYVGGGDAGATSAGTGDAQKAARDGAFAVYDAIAEALAPADALASVIPQGWSEIGEVSLVQTAPADAEPGRRADITFAVHVTNRMGAS